MFDTGTHFHGLKKLALEAIMRHESPVVPDSGEEHVIRSDHCHHAVGVVAAKWNSQHMGKLGAQIVIVTPGVSGQQGVE
jgi:hypothetical protein